MATWNPGSAKADRRASAYRTPAVPAADHVEEPEGASTALMVTKMGRTGLAPAQMLALQAASGNRAVSRLVLQRHSVTSMPPKPEPEEEDAVQRLWDPPSTAARVQRHALADLPDRPRPDDEPVQRLWDPPNALQRNFLAGHRVRAPKAPTRPPPAIPGFGAMALTKGELPADGASTSQGSLTVGGNRTDLTWSIADVGTGTTVSQTGLVTAGTTMGAKEEKTATVTVRENAGQGRSASLPVRIVDPVVHQARADYATFVAGGPYTWPNFRTANGFGRFDATYLPNTKLLRIDMRMKFFFPDDPIAGNAKQRKAAQDRQDAYATTILQQAKAGWDRKFQFRNVRAPTSVWGQLGPVNVETNFTRTNAADQHFQFYAKNKSEGTANVTPTGKTTFYKNDETVQQAFNPEAQVGETSRVNQAAPDLYVKNDGSLTTASRTSAEFLGLYLKRLHVPPFKLKVRGHGGRKVGLANAATAKSAIVAGGLAAPHTIDCGWRAFGSSTRVSITPKVDGAWRNVQDITAHEFGHMLGLDDEYATTTTPAGKGIETYDRVKALFGKQYADLTSKAGVDSASIMDGGSDVRVQHSVTLWDVLNDITNQKAAVPTPKLGEADWKAVD
jgi:hypothetical protein